MQRLTFILALLLSCIFSATTLAASDVAKEKKIYGRIEQVAVHPEGFLLEAKLDTGAKMSSLDAHNIKLYKQNGITWVDFELTPNHFEAKKVLHYKLERYINIKNRHQEVTNGQQMQMTRRPVIKMQVCLDRQLKTIDVNLINRSEFNYPMLLGRDAMESFKMLIDPSEKFTTEPSCGTP